MEELLPLGVYRANSGINRRTAVVMSVFWGAGMLAFSGVTRMGLRQALFEVGLLVFAAVLFGLLWAPTMRWMVGGLLARLHAGDSKLVPPPPPGRWDARLLCSLVRRIVIGGHLYVGPDAWVFVPHRKNLAAHQAPVALGRPDQLSVSLIQGRPNALARLIMPGPSRRVRVAGPAGEHLLVVPQADWVAERLQQYADAARAGTHPPGGEAR